MKEYKERDMKESLTPQQIKIICERMISLVDSSDEYNIEMDYSDVANMAQVIDGRGIHLAVSFVETAEPDERV